VGNGDDFDENPNPYSQGDDNCPKEEEVQKELGKGFACVACIEVMDSEPTKEYS
jgi:hypothetical protein